MRVRMARRPIMRKFSQLCSMHVRSTIVASTH